MWRVLRLAQTSSGQRRRTHALAGLVGAIAVLVGLAGCSSGGGSASGTETVTGIISGAAAANLINANTLSPLTFPTLTFSGPITTSATNATIRADTSAQTIVTADGTFTVTLSLRGKGQTGRTWIGEQDGNCTFTQNPSTGNYQLDGSQSTGKFAGAVGNGSYLITLRGAAPLLAGKTTCTTTNTGEVVPESASITFKATGPLEPKSS